MVCVLWSFLKVFYLDFKPQNDVCYAYDVYNVHVHIDSHFKTSYSY